MKRLRFPLAMPYDVLDFVVRFRASRAELAVLGEPGFVETDSSRMFGTSEYFWGFETAEGLRLQVCWHQGYDDVTVHADPPDPAATIAALRALGLSAEFEARTLAHEKRLQRGHARGTVWLFFEREATAPAAVFSRKQHADAWLARSRSSGALVAYPLDLPLSELAKVWGSNVQSESYAYVDGVQLA